MGVYTMLWGHAVGARHGVPLRFCHRVVCRAMPWHVLTSGMVPLPENVGWEVFGINRHTIGHGKVRMTKYEGQTKVGSTNFEGRTTAG